MTAPLEIKTTSNLYETDFVAWAQQQALLLKQGRLEELDLTNLIEEVEGLSRSDKRAREKSGDSSDQAFGRQASRAVSVRLPKSLDAELRASLGAGEDLSDWLRKAVAEKLKRDKLKLTV